MKTRRSKVYLAKKKYQILSDNDEESEEMYDEPTPRTSKERKEKQNMHRGSPNKKQHPMKIDSAKSNVNDNIEEIQLEWETLPDVPSYTVSKVLRCHGDINDNVTKIWQSAFEPPLNGDDATSSIVATCAGESVCIIDCETCQVVKRLDLTTSQILLHEPEVAVTHGGLEGVVSPVEALHTLAWTTVKLGEGGRKTNVLATAGYLGYLYLVHPDKLVVYARDQIHKSSVNTILFHPRHTTWLFSGSDDGSIVWSEIPIPKPPYYTQTARFIKRFHLGKTSPLDLVFSTKHHLLVCGGDGEMCEAFHIKHTKSKDATRYEFDVPDVTSPYRGKKDDSCPDLYDGISLITQDIIATKLACRGVILLWSLAQIGEENYNNDDDEESDEGEHAENPATKVKVQILARLLWSDYQQPYIYLSSQLDSGLLLAGDKDRVWLYDLSDLINQHQRRRRQHRPKQGHHKRKRNCDDVAVAWYLPSKVHAWPPCVSQNKEVVVNRCVASKDGKYLVAGTSLNLVGIFTLK